MEPEYSHLGMVTTQLIVHFVSAEVWNDTEGATGVALYSYSSDFFKFGARGRVENMPLGWSAPL